MMEPKMEGSMKVGVFTVGLPDLTPEEAVRELKDAGYDGVGWRVTRVPEEARGEEPSFWGNHLCTLEHTEEEARRARRISEEAGLEVPGLGTYVAVRDLEAADEAMRFAVTAGAAQVRVGAGAPDGRPYEELFTADPRVADGAWLTRERLAWHVGEGVGVRAAAAALTLVERGDFFHIVGIELEVEELEVLPHARWRHRLREHDVASLDVPPQNDLRRRLAHVISDPGDGGIVEHLALRYWRPRFGGDAVILSVFSYGFVGEVGVYLDLVHRRYRVGLRGQPLQVVDLEVRYADRAGTAVVVKLFERHPGGDEVAVVERRQRPVDQEQIHVVEAQIGERRVQSPAGVVGLVQSVVELARDEDVVAVDARGANPLTDLYLVAVHLRRVDVPVADLDGLSNRLCGVFGLDLKHPETELRDCVSIVQGYVWYHAQSRTTPSCLVNCLPDSGAT